MSNSTKQKEESKSKSVIQTQVTNKLLADTPETTSTNRSLSYNTTDNSSDSATARAAPQRSPERKDAPLSVIHNKSNLTADRAPVYTKIARAVAIVNIAYYAHCMFFATGKTVLVTVKLISWCAISSLHMLLSSVSVSGKSNRRFSNNLCGVLGCFRVISLVMLATTTLFSFHNFAMATTAFSYSFPWTTFLLELFITTIYTSLEQTLKQSMDPQLESSMYQTSSSSSLTDVKRDTAKQPQLQPAMTEESRLAQKNQFLSIVSQEIRDTCSMIMTTLEQFSPSPLLVPSTNELLSACSLAVPVSSIAAITTTVKHARHISSNLHLLSRILQYDGNPATARQQPSANHCHDFDMGELIQHIGDALAGLSAKLGVHIVIHHMDNGFYFPPIFADEAAIKHALLTLLLNIIECSTPGACIELGLMMQPSPDQDNTSNKVRVTLHIVQTASPAIPVGLNKAMIPNINYTEKLIDHINGQMETEPMEKNRFKIEINLDLEPSSNNNSNSHSHTGSHDSHLFKNQSHPHMFFDKPSRFFETQFANMRFASEPTLKELSMFLTRLKGVKLILHAPEKSNFAKHLTSCLTSWNTDISHLPVLTYATSSNDDVESAADGASGISGPDIDSAASFPSMFSAQQPSGMKTPLENVLSQSTATATSNTDLSPASSRSVNSNNTATISNQQKIPSPAIEEDHIHSIPPAFILIDDDILTLERKLRHFREGMIQQQQQQHQQQQQLQRQSSVNTTNSSGSGSTTNLSNDTVSSNARNNSNNSTRTPHHHPSIHHGHHPPPHHHRRNKSRTNDSSSGHGTVAIIFFTSLSNYKKVRETIQWYTSASLASPAVQPLPTMQMPTSSFTLPTASTLPTVTAAANTAASFAATTIPSYHTSHYYLPRVVVVPKPAGPRRFLTALHTAWHNALVEPNFVPIATSPMSPMMMNLLPTTAATTDQPQQQQQHHLVTTPSILPSTATPHHVHPYVQHSYYAHDMRYSPRRMHSPHQLEGAEKGNYFFVDSHRPLTTSPSLLAATTAAPLAVNSQILTVPQPAASIAAVASSPSPPPPTQAQNTAVPITVGPSHNTVSAATMPGTPTEVKRRLRSKSSLRRAFVSSGGVGTQLPLEGGTLDQRQPGEAKESLMSPTERGKATSPIKITTNINSNAFADSKLPSTTITSPTSSTKKTKKSKKNSEKINSPITAANTVVNAGTINTSATSLTSPNTATMPNTNIPTTLNPCQSGTPAPVNITVDASTALPTTTTAATNTTIPSTPAPAPAPTPTTNPTNKPKSKFNFKISNRKRKEKVNSSGKHGPPITVLIVEDNMINQAILSTWMKKHSIKFSVASDGKEAVEKWKGGGFHLILMDIQLPVMDGIEATKMIRAIEKERKIGVLPSSSSSTSTLSSENDDHHNVVQDKSLTEKPEAEDTDNIDNKTKGDETQGGGIGGGGFQSPVIIVALTASSLESDRQAALAAGCNDFLTKPVSLEWLEKKIMEWGCMQALIDFEGWRKWKRSSPSTNTMNTTTPASKAQKSQQPYLTFNNQRPLPPAPNNNNGKEEIEREKELLALRTKEMLQDETRAIVLMGVHRRKVSSNIPTPTAVQHQRTQSSSSSTNDPRVLQQQLSRYMDSDKLPLPKVPSDPDLYQHHHPFEYLSIPQQVEERARRRVLEL